VTPSSTPLPTATPTLTAKDICDSFSVVSIPAMNAQYEFDGVALFGWRGAPANVSLVLSITLHGSVAGIRAVLPQASDSIFPLPLVRLPSPGVYDWKISLQHPTYGEICTSSGSFIRLAFSLI
jgi:hypothetical protein